MVMKMRPLCLIAFIILLLLVSSGSSSSVQKRRLILRNDIDNEQYAVIFDGGSTGSRVHVYRFDEYLDLLKIGDDFEYYEAIKPGLSAYAKDPKAAALSLVPLLQNALQQVPDSFKASKPIFLGATAGLRLLEGDAPDLILEEVKDLFSKSGVMFNPDRVSVLDGYHEGAYLWVAMNYLLGNFAESRHSRTVATIDLGGGSVQMAYAISPETAQVAPKPSNGEEPYVQDMFLLGSSYSVYAHSYLSYGYLAARAAILSLTNNTVDARLLEKFFSEQLSRFYEYNGVVYKASSRDAGASLRKCKELVKQVLNVHSLCKYKSCSFNGAWNGGGGAGRRNINIVSHFYHIAVQAEIITPGVTSQRVRPINYMNAAQVACNTSIVDMKTTFPQLEDDNVPYFCLDLTYEYLLLVEGFRVQRTDNVTALIEFTYKNTSLEVSWPIGASIDVVSSINKPSSYVVA